MKQYDVLVIGAGSAGLSVGISMKRLGFTVLIVEKNDHRIGGDCLNDGCVPSKALIYVSKQVHHARSVDRFGVKAAGAVDMAEVMQYVRERQDIIRAHENDRYLRETEGIDVALGVAHFVGETEVEVVLNDGETMRATAKNIVLCTGSLPRQLEAEGLDAVAKVPGKLHTNQTIFSLKTLPKRLLIVGAGPIGIEMAQAFGRLGSAVTVVGTEERILDKELPEVSELLKKQLEKEGITFKLKRKVTAFPDVNTAEMKAGNGHTDTIPFDVVLVAIGRTFQYDALNLPVAGIELYDRGRLTLNDYLQTTNKHVFAVGDAAAGAPAGQRLFSHGAELQASIVVGNFITPGVFGKKLTYDHFSWVTFTDPEVATFGFSEEDLKTRGKEYERIEYDFARDDRAVIEDYEYARMILFVSPSGINPFGPKILGGTIIAPKAGELIQELILAQQKGLTAGDFFNKTYPYPTASRVNKSIWVDKIGGHLPDLVKKGAKWLYE
ncbi:dihydrolipoyl dehydrogenase family protein [Spirosoma spitsbergense]|uniref:dihydrolipoyl dehydrogenase family protein n=1 Tax=Spirosoma spitsbergense TaxID=431554 RepID=UPI00036A45AA|nr:NAD(P)/FAD-dependent oxidoreductase [Spirosoma spitsbergense]